MGYAIEILRKSQFQGQFLAKIVVNGFWSAKYTKTRKKLATLLFVFFNVGGKQKTIGIVSNIMIERDCNILQIPLHYKFVVKTTEVINVNKF